jgi:hypothetical protein
VHDILVAVPSSGAGSSTASRGELYLARATDNALVAIEVGAHTEAGAPAEGGAQAHGGARTLAVLEAPVRAMVLADGALWLTTGHSIEAVPIAGGAPTVVAAGFARPGSLASNGRWVVVVDVDADGGGLTHASTVVVVSATGGAHKLLGRAEGEVNRLALDDANVYWADRLEGTIVAVPVSGGAPRVLASDRGLPGDIALDGDDLYWVEKRSESLWTMPKTGGPPRRLVQDFAGFANLLVQASGVAWTNEAAVEGAFQVLTVPRSGGEVRAMGPAVDGIDAIAGDGKRVFWDRAGDIGVVEE